MVTHILANVENQLDARSSGLSIFWWAIFILVDLICWWVSFYSGGLSLFWWAVYIFWWVILMGHLYSGGLM